MNDNMSSVHVFFKNPNTSAGSGLHPLHTTCGHHLPVTPPASPSKFHPQSLLHSLYVLVNVSHSPRPTVSGQGSKVGDLVLKSGGDLLEAECQLFVLGGRVLVQRLDDLRTTA